MPELHGHIIYVGKKKILTWFLHVIFLMVAFFGEIQSAFMHSLSSKFSLFLPFEETKPELQGGMLALPSSFY